MYGSLKKKLNYSIKNVQYMPQKDVQKMSQKGSLMFKITSYKCPQKNTSSGRPAGGIYMSSFVRPAGIGCAMREEESVMAIIQPMREQKTKLDLRENTRQDCSLVILTLTVFEHNGIAVKSRPTQRT